MIGALGDLRVVSSPFAPQGKIYLINEAALCPAMPMPMPFDTTPRESMSDWMRRTIYAPITIRPEMAMILMSADGPEQRKWTAKKYRGPRRMSRRATPQPQKESM